jgi:hypothetical protein
LPLSDAMIHLQAHKAGGDRLSEVQQAKLQESAPKTRSKEVSDSLVTTKRDSTQNEKTTST